VRCLELDPAFHDVLVTLRAREGNGPPLFSPAELIVANARRFARTPEERARFGRSVYLRSVNPAIAPAVRGQPKAAVFAGDVLYAAGFVAPVTDGFYPPAPEWPRWPLFQPVGARWARPGDLLVVGAHIEVITEVSGAAGLVVSLGARLEGLVEDDVHGRMLARARRHGEQFIHAGQLIYVLRIAVQER
jgi:hypothetical protein